MAVTHHKVVIASEERLYVHNLVTPVAAHIRKLAQQVVSPDIHYIPEVVPAPNILVPHNRKVAALQVVEQPAVELNGLPA